MKLTSFQGHDLHYAGSASRPKTPLPLLTANPTDHSLMRWALALRWATQPRVSKLGPTPSSAPLLTMGSEKACTSSFFITSRKGRYNRMAVDRHAIFSLNTGAQEPLKAVRRKYALQA